MDVEKKKKFIINFTYFALILAIAILLCRYALPRLLPFFIALLIALLLKPVVRFLHEKCRIKRNIAGLVLSVLFYAIVGLLVAALSIWIYSVARNFVMNLPSLYSNQIEPWLLDLFDRLESFVAKLNPSAAAAYDVVAARVTTEAEALILSLSKRLLAIITNTVVGLPKFLLNALIAVIATVFLAIDWTMISDFILRQCNERTKLLLGDIGTHLGSTMIKYTKSYALIMTITFLEIAIGLSIVGVERALFIAFIIAVFDILPVVGSGMVLLPWTILTLLSGDYAKGIGLGILYVVVIVVRNVIEPKIVGDKVGLHPIVTLMAMVVGTYVFGAIGLLGLPITLALLVSLNEQGVIHVYQKTPKPGEAAGAPEQAADADGADGAGASFCIVDEPAASAHAPSAETGAGEEEK